jgi:hypothetical protein
MVTEIGVHVTSKWGLYDFNTFRSYDDSIDDAGGSRYPQIVEEPSALATQHCKCEADDRC